jgi:hypothetical protein
MPFNQEWPGYQRPLDQTELAAFAYWDMSEPVTVEVIPRFPVEHVAIRPASRGIKPVVDGGRVVFPLARPGQVVVEVNGIHHALHLFASAPQEDAPGPDAPGVIYFGPGVHRAGRIQLNSGGTVYLSGGAVVHGFIEARDASDIRIAGRGVLDQSTFERGKAGGAISLHNCRNVRIEGIVMRDPDVWTVIPTACQDVEISNVKLVGLWRYNSDGIDLVNSQRVSVRDSFVRSFDDSIVLKGLKGRRGTPTGELPVRNVTVSSCVIWNDWGRALEIGAETVAPEISNIVFRDCDIIRCAHVAMDVQNGDRATVKDLLFDDIRLEVDEKPLRPVFQRARDQVYETAEGYCPRLFVAEIVKTHWNKDEERGHVDGVRLRNISVTGHQFPPSRLSGFDAAHMVRNVAFEGVAFNGRPLTSASEACVSQNEFVAGVTFSKADA